MEETKNYCEYMAFKFEDLLKNSIFALVKGEDESSYYLRDYDACHLSEQQAHLFTVDKFIEKLKSYIDGKERLNFIYEKHSIEIYYSFSRDIFNKLIYDDVFAFPPNKIEAPTVEQLIRIASLFKDGCMRVDSIFDIIPRGEDINGRDYEDFLLYLMTIPNKHLFDDKKFIVNIISGEISTFTSYFYAETNLKVKDAFKTYLGNRTEFFEKINDDSLEERLFQRIKKSLAPKYWSEMAAYFPSLVDKNRKIAKDNLIEADDVKIYQLNLNKGAFYNYCPSIVDSKDLRQAFHMISKAIDATKPDEIDIMQDYEMEHNIKIIFSGKDLDESYKDKFARLYGLMIEEYNSDNVDKYQFKEKRVENIEYLKKAAKMHWMEVMLEPSQNNKNKKMKM